MALCGTNKERESMSTIYDLNKTQEKVEAALARNPEGSSRMSPKLLRSINEHLWRLQDLEK